MKLLIVSCLLAAAFAAPQTNYNQGRYNPYQYQPQRYQQQRYYQQPQYYQQQQQQYQYVPKNVVPIVSESNNLNPDGSFSYSYVTGDGQQAQAQGYLKNAGYKDQEAEVIQGSYSYTSPDGTPITVTYTADENGFRAEGAHLPTPPPIPEAILRSIAYNEQVARSQPYQQQQGYYQQQRYQRGVDKE